MSTYPLRFAPNLQTSIWGGTRLKPLKGLPADAEPIGESWEVSGVSGHLSVVDGGALSGKTLDEAIREWGAALLGRHIYNKYGGQCPLLVKLIDAASELSIQVHPNDALAHERHGSLGKTEMWYVVSAEPGATLLTGFREKLTPEDYARRVADGSIVDALARYEVKAGDVFFIPAGRIHALCGGIMVCEVQQSSDITYRLFDYGRTGLDGKPRELHTEQALAAIDFNVLDDYRTHYTPAPGAVALVDCPYFRVNLLTSEDAVERRLAGEDSFVTLTCVEGSARVATANGADVTLPRGASCLIPAAEADFRIEGHARLIEAWAR